MGNCFTGTEEEPLGKGGKKNSLRDQKKTRKKAECPGDTAKNLILGGNEREKKKHPKKKEAKKKNSHPWVAGEDLGKKHYLSIREGGSRRDRRDMMFGGKGKSWGKKTKSRRGSKKANKPEQHHGLIARLWPGGEN